MHGTRAPTKAATRFCRSVEGETGDRAWHKRRLSLHGSRTGRTHQDQVSEVVLGAKVVLHPNADLIDRFRANGKGSQSRINEALRKAAGI